MEVVCYFSFARLLYDMNENVFAFFSCLLDDGWMLLRNVELISIPRALHPSMIPSSTTARHSVALSTTSHKTQASLSINYKRCKLVVILLRSSRNGVVRCGRLGVNGKLYRVNSLLLKCGEILEKQKTRKKIDGKYFTKTRKQKTGKKERKTEKYGWLIFYWTQSQMRWKRKKRNTEGRVVKKRTEKI
uniref:Uncharacterized protein n=1 Tax=Oryza punctata TaxID=4537 RepID=A0A0E0LM09_ORYPU